MKIFDENDCNHEKCVKNGKTKNGKQRLKCKMCGKTFVVQNFDAETFYNNILMFLMTNKKQNAFEFLSPHNPISYEHFEFPSEYLIDSKNITWSTFRRKIKKEKIDTPILVFYTTYNEMNKRNLYIYKVSKDN